jgi:hypothetical protein
MLLVVLLLLLLLPVPELLLLPLFGQLATRICQGAATGNGHHSDASSCPLQPP